MACDQVVEAMGERDGRPGCLKGKPEDYVKSIDAMIAQKDAAFAKNKAALQVIIDSGNPHFNEIVSSLAN